MEGRHPKRRIAFATALAAALTSVAVILLPGTGAALERSDCSLAPNPAYANGPNGPRVVYVGDSISNLVKDYYAFINGDKGWKTEVLATGGATIDQHRCSSWGSWLWARNTAPPAVVVELGTNDVSGINESLTQSQALREFARAFNSTKWAADYLNSRCVIWVGQNERFDSYVTIGDKRIKYVDKDAAAAFDRNLKSLVSSHPRLHYADYSAFIRDNDIYRNSFTSRDSVHPGTAEGKRELAAWVSRRIDNNCI